MFSSASTIATRNSAVSSMMATLQAERPQISINIDGDDPAVYSGRFGSFSTLDTINGEVGITTTSDTRFDDIQITFEGQQRTWMDKFGPSPGMSGRSTSTFTVSKPFDANLFRFLRLSQPVNESVLPIPRIAQKDKKYTFPFTFVIPERLLDSSCNHNIENTTVHEAHLQLPPSAGDSSLPGERGCLIDDFFPGMARISYFIQVKILRRRESDGKAITLANSARKVRVAPNFEGIPPVHVDDHPGDYVLHIEKDIKRGLFKGKLGRFIVEAEQPKDLRLSKNSRCPAATTVPVSLWFVPTDSSFEPPKLGLLKVKLKISTYFSTSAINYAPTPGSRTNDPSLGHYFESLLLSSRCMAGVKWSKQSLPGPTTYKVTLLIPITAPKDKELIPSFMSCLISRSYTLSLSVSIQASVYSRLSVSLKIPFQISHPSSSSQITIPQDVSVDDFFAPHSVVPPQLEQDRPGLPGYSVFAGAVPPPPRIPSPVGISPGCC